MRSSYLIAGLALAAAIILGLTYYLRQVGPQAEPPAPAVEPLQAPQADPEERTPARSLEMMEETPPSPAIAEPVLVLPSLDASDAFVRERLPESLHLSLPEAWLEKDDLLRRVAVVLENANRGEIPKRQLAFLAPDGRFTIREVEREGEQDALKFVDPQSYARYDRYLDMLEVLPPAGLATLFADAGPLLTEAMAELGTQDAVVPQLLVAIEQILAVPVIRGDVELVQPKVLYEYADPALEGLSDLQKQVLRMGPDNVERLKAYLEDLRQRLTGP